MMRDKCSKPNTSSSAGNSAILGIGANTRSRFDMLPPRAAWGRVGRGPLAVIRDARSKEVSPRRHGGHREVELTDDRALLGASAALRAALILQPDEQDISDAHPHAHRLCVLRASVVNSSWWSGRWRARRGWGPHPTFPDAARGGGVRMGLSG